MEEMGSEKRRLVVIGGGIAGSLLAKSLQFHADVTFIDPYVLYSFSFMPLYHLIMFFLVLFFLLLNIYERCLWVIIFFMLYV